MHDMKADQAKITQHEVILGTYGRESSDENWEIIEVGILDFWKSAVTSLHKADFALASGHVQIEIDWTPLVQQFEAYINALTQIKKYGISALDPDPFPRDQIKINAGLSIYGSVNYYPKDLIASYLYDIFLIANISAPSSLNLYRYTIDGDNSLSTFTSVIFESIYDQSISHDLKSLQFLPPEKVRDWYYSIRKFGGHAPRNSAEKAIFSVLHMAKEGASPITAIWIFYCLETLFQTRVGENFRSLVERISSLLELSSKEKNTIKNRLRKLYDLRSSVVHGGFEITHPMQSDFYLDGADEHYYRILPDLDFGYALVLRCIQMFARNGWVSLKIVETVTGNSIPLKEQ